MSSAVVDLGCGVGPGLSAGLTPAVAELDRDTDVLLAEAGRAAWSRYTGLVRLAPPVYRPGR